MTIKPLDIVKLESKAGNIYEAVVIAAKRARQINDEMRIEYNQKLEPIMEKEVDDENVVSKDKFNISVDFEKRVKPTETGLDELMDDKVKFRERKES